MKDVLEVDGEVSLPLSHRISNSLFMFDSTPHDMTGPKLFFGFFLKCYIRTWFSLLEPELSRQIEEKQATQKHHHDHGVSPAHVLLEGETQL